MKNRIWVATLKDGSQILINYWAEDDSVTIATRSETYFSWGPPIHTEDRTPGEQL